MLQDRHSRPTMSLLLLLCCWCSFVVAVIFPEVVSFPVVVQLAAYQHGKTTIRQRTLRYQQQPVLYWQLYDAASMYNIAISASTSAEASDVVSRNTATDESCLVSSSSPTSTTSSITTSSQQQLGSPICIYDQLTIPMNSSNSDVGGIIPQQEILVYDVTKQIQQFVSDHNVQCGTITLFNRHTTTSLIINEYESRLIRDIQANFLKLVPPDVRSYAYQRLSPGTFPNNTQYEHNDIHLRPESTEETQRCYDNGYNISNVTILQEWRSQEPINAHSHLLCMMIGSNSLTVPISNHSIQIGQWQSIMLIDFDGPRHGRTVGIQVMGYTTQ